MIENRTTDPHTSQAFLRLSSETPATARNAPAAPTESDRPICSAEDVRVPAPVDYAHNAPNGTACKLFPKDRICWPS